MDEQEYELQEQTQQGQEQDEEQEENEMSETLITLQQNKKSNDNIIQNQDQQQQQQQQLQQIEYQREISQTQQEIYESIIIPQSTKSSKSQIQQQQQVQSQQQQQLKQQNSPVKNENTPIKSKEDKFISHNNHINNKSQVGQPQQNQQYSHKKNKSQTSSQQNSQQINQSTSPIIIGEVIDNTAPYIYKAGLINHLSSPSLRLYHRGKQKRNKSNKEDLLFYRSPYHEKKYLGNEIYPPEPLKIQELPNSQQDLFTFKPQINQPVMTRKNSKLQIQSAQPSEIKNVGIEFIEYMSSPITIKNTFKNNPSCMHNLVNKKTLNKTKSTNFIFLRTINLQENRKTIFESINQQPQQHKINPQLNSVHNNNHNNNSSNFNYNNHNNNNFVNNNNLSNINNNNNNIMNNNSNLSNNMSNKNMSQQIQNNYKKQQNQLLQQYPKYQIKEHNINDYLVKGYNKIHFQNANQCTQTIQQSIKLPPFAASLENINNFSIAKNNLIKYVNAIKL